MTAKEYFKLKIEKCKTQLPQKEKPVEKSTKKKGSKK